MTALVLAGIESLRVAARDVDAYGRAYDTGHHDVARRLAQYAADRAEEAAILLREAARTIEPARLVPVATADGIEWVLEGEIPIDDDVSQRIDAMRVAA